VAPPFASILAVLVVAEAQRAVVGQHELREHLLVVDPLGPAAPALEEVCRHGGRRSAELIARHPRNPPVIDGERGADAGAVVLVHQAGLDLVAERPAAPARQGDHHRQRLSGLRIGDVVLDDRPAAELIGVGDLRGADGVIDPHAVPVPINHKRGPGRLVDVD
jgi:hypothetical protein